MSRDLGSSPLLGRQRRRRRRRGVAPKRAFWLFALGLGATAAWIYRPAALTSPLARHQAQSTGASTPAPATSAAVPATNPLAAAHATETAETPSLVNTQEPRLRFGPADPFQPFTVKLQSGETLFQALLRTGMRRDQAARVVDALRDELDFRRLRPGDRMTGTLWRGESFLEGMYRQGVRDRYLVEPGADGSLQARYDPLPVERRRVAVTGEVEGSLFVSMQRQGARAQLIMQFVELFQWSFDFATQARPGHRFAMLVEQEYVDGTFVGYGPILAARYHPGDDTIAACWYSGHGDSREGAGQYHPSGRAVKGAFLRTPLNYTRISSGYTHRRFHPVLKRYRPHRGIDYAAPSGTPVYTVGDGYVLGAGWMGGAGKAIRVRHPNGWITSYSHLSRILVRKGQRVKQGQLIGRVGSTGHSTGPHLDFRITINGRFVNPLRVDYPRGKSIPDAFKQDFRTQCRRQMQALDAALDTGTQVARRRP